MIVLGVVVKACELRTWKKKILMNVKAYVFNHVINLYLFLIVSLYICYFAQNSPITKKTKGETFSKVYHFILWFILGSVSAIIGHLFGQLCSIRTFKTFGEIIILACYLMAFSTLYSLTFCLKKDLFDLII